MLLKIDLGLYSDFQTTGIKFYKYYIPKANKYIPVLPSASFNDLAWDNDKTLKPAFWSFEYSLPASALFPLPNPV